MSKAQDEQDALTHAEEIGAKTEGEARAKVKSDEANARPTPSPAPGGKQSNIEYALGQLGISLGQVKSYREDSGMAIVETHDGGPAKRVEIAKMFEPMIERALEALGIEKEDIKAAPGVSPTAIEIPVKGVKKGDPRFEGKPGVSVPQDGMVQISRQYLMANDNPGATRKASKPSVPVSTDLEALTIAKLGVNRRDVKSIKRDGEEMVVTMNSGAIRQVRVATL